jgi:Flp pilus assembly pilin Flp
MLAQQIARTRQEMGQGLVEYALLIVLLAILLIVALNLLGSGITGALYNEIIANL